MPQPTATILGTNTPNARRMTRAKMEEMNPMGISLNNAFLNRTPAFYVYIYNVSDIQHRIERPWAHPAVIVPPCEEGEAVSAAIHHSRHRGRSAANRRRSHQPGRKRHRREVSRARRYPSRAAFRRLADIPACSSGKCRKYGNRFVLAGLLVVAECKIPNRIPKKLLPRAGDSKQPTNN